MTYLVEFFHWHGDTASSSNHNVINLQNRLNELAAKGYTLKHALPVSVGFMLIFVR